MATKRRPSTGPGFGDDGGTNVAEYLGLWDRVHEPERPEDGGERIVNVSVNRIDRSPYQVRVDFDAGQLEAFAEDVKTIGLNHPVTLRAKPDGRYELVAGERRWLAVRAAGREYILARIRELDEFDAHLVGVSENNQRANLSPWESVLEAFELRRHAVANGRPHAQRDLARYLGRNVTTVNQQLAIAGAITVDLLASANVDARDVGHLSHEALHRIARLESADRARALADAVRRRVKNGAARVAARGAGKHDSSTQAEEDGDRWTSLWERGGFHVHIRKPLRDVEPAEARKYLDDLLPGICGLAARAAKADGDGASATVDWEHEHGRLVYIPPAGAFTAQGREAAREVLGRVVANLEGRA